MNGRMNVGILDCGSGNLRSLAKAVERAGGERGLGVRVRIVGQAGDIACMQRLLLPGVGAFSYAMSGLEQRPGLRAALEDAVLHRGRPFLGICVGMQILMQWGLEHGRSRGLGWLPGTAHPLQPGGGLRVPHTGWNELRAGAHPVFAHLRGRRPCHVYFSHSYHVRLEDARHRLATSEYGGTLTAAAGRDNIVGMQFHPEKSQRAGLELLGGFLAWNP